MNEAPQDRVNIALFGTAWSVAVDGAPPVYAPQITDGNPDTCLSMAAGQILQIEWRQPRDVSRVVVSGPLLPPPQDIQVQYWYRIWPDNGEGGWQRLDDPFNGRWVTVKASAVAGAEGLIYTFAPLDKEENPLVERTGFPFRHIYKIRLTFQSPARVSEVEACSSATWKTAAIRLEWSPCAGNRAIWNGRIQARNAHILSVTPTGRTSGPVVIGVRYADVPDRRSADRGMLIFRAPGWRSFAVFVDDVVREGGIYVRDIDAFVSDASQNLSYATWKGPAEKWDATVMEKVASLPEQRLEQALKAIPAKPPREAHLGVPNMRQEFTIDPVGNILLLKQSLRTPGRDADRRPWDAPELRYALSTGEQPVFTPEGGRQVRRFLAENYLPVLHTEWRSGDLQYRQAAFATVLLGGIGDEEDARTGDEPLVLLDRMEIENTGSAAQTAYLWVELPLKAPVHIREDGLLVLHAPSDGKPRAGLTPVRGRVDINGRGELACLPDCVPAAGDAEQDRTQASEPRPVLRYTVRLAPGETHALFLYVPYIELLNDAELAALKRLRFDSRHAEAVHYWRKRIHAGMRYEVPEPLLNDLFRTSLWHVLVSTDRDPETGLYQHGAATMGYLNYANETCMVAQSLQMRGEHREAFRLLEPFLVSQGVKPLPGNFQSQEGLFYAAYPDAAKDVYTARGYNMHHGWVLWHLAEHYKWTRDADYLQSVAPHLVAACDWITRERQATKVLNPDGTKPVEWGLAPAGDLEDVEETLYWYATNAYYYLGLNTAAEVLAEIKHPAAARLKKDAEDYRADILASVKESLATSPVVRLKDGTYVPYVPPRAYVLTHLVEGWIRESLYPALHLLDGNLVEPRHPLVTWLLQDLEDNIFLSKESGYGVADQAACFFDFGGFTLQPNLLSNAMAHLRRDEIPHFLRVFYNTCSTSLYPDTMCFAEWVSDYGRGGGPLYKTPDECRFVQFMRNLLVFEEGGTLNLGMGVPRAWMTDGKVIRIEKAATCFGPMAMTITSHASEGTITASLVLPSRNPPARTFLRLRHPEGRPMRRVTVNGKDWQRFEAAKERITLPGGITRAEVIASF
ncbi:MAG: hypothetical protein HY320_04720 [Armatimonadetes bacterium]|nr:hypothetical protein [Armatimonadota bacterium]